MGSGWAGCRDGARLPGASLARRCPENEDSRQGQGSHVCSESAVVSRVP